MSPVVDFEVVGPDPKILELVKEILAQNRIILEANADTLRVLNSPPLIRGVSHD